MFLLQKSENKLSSRNQIGIKGVKDGVLILPNNRYRYVIKVSSLNFELKSEEEQDVLIETYESFLNSVGTPLQILIRTREIDLDKYLFDLNDKLEDEIETVYKNQLRDYKDFIKSLVQTNKILSRNFYVILSYNADSNNDFNFIKEQLNVLIDVVAKGLSRLGMQIKELSSLETLDLFYSFYNPEQAKVQPLTEQALQLIHANYI